MRRARLVVIGVAALLACEGPDIGFPWDFERMLEQPRYDTYASSDFFEDGRAMQRPPEGTVAREPEPLPPWRAHAELEEATGPPPEPDMGLLTLGRERFGIFCAACHGEAGYADTRVARAMALRPPPSLHEPRIRALPDVRLLRVVEEGYGLMPGYGKVLSAQEQWAVLFYVRALQTSQHVELEALPPQLRERTRAALEGGQEGAP